jgi:hypothetical protein
MDGIERAQHEASFMPDLALTPTSAIATQVKDSLESLVTIFGDGDSGLSPAQRCKLADAIWVLGELVDLLEK